MKNWYVKVGMMIAAAVTLTACPGKKGNNAAAPAPVYGAGVCAIDPATGGCVGQVPFNGGGRWRGNLIISPAQIILYRQFLAENGLCQGWQCNQPSQYLGVSIRADGPQGRVTITPFENYGWSRNRLARRASVSTVNNVSGFNMVVIDNRQYIQAQVYPQPIVAPNNTIQLSNTFITPYGNTMTTTLFYRGVPIASGQLQGQRSDYAQSAAYGQPGPGVVPYVR